MPALSSMLTSLIEIVGSASTLVIVPVPVTLAIPPIVSNTVSLASFSASLIIGTITLYVVTPAGTVKTPFNKVTPLVKVVLLILISAAFAVLPAASKL